VANTRVPFPRFPPLHAWGKASIWPLEARTARRFLFGLILLGSVGLLYLSLASEIATTGDRIRAQWDEIETLCRERDRKLLQLAEQLSLPRLQDEAERRGFGPVTEVHHLTGLDLTESPISASEPAARNSEKGGEGVHEGELLTSIEARLSRWWRGAIARFAIWTTIEARKTP